MTVGYIRVSSADQNPARQEEALKSHGVERVFEEKIFGKDMNRPKLKELLDFVREGDTVIGESYSRLARSTKDLLFIIDKLQEKKVSFVSLKENIDTSTPQGKLMLTIFAVFPSSTGNALFNVRLRESPSPKQKASTKVVSQSRSQQTGIMSSGSTEPRS